MKMIIDSEQFGRLLKRLTHEIIERNENLSDVILVGIANKGVPVAECIASLIYSFEGVTVPVESINIGKHRDDNKKALDATIEFKADVINKTVILVDDVLFTGRSVRAAMDAIIDLGRPAKIELAILVDRGHRELPIRADFVGKNIPTSKSERVICDFVEKTIMIE